MRRLALAAALSVALGGQAHARALHGTAATSGGSGGGLADCSLTGLTVLGINDGCSSAPTAVVNSELNFYKPNAFTDGTLFQTAGQTQTRAARIDWPVAGVNYPVGVKTPSYCNGGSLPCSPSPNATGLIDLDAYLAANINGANQLVTDPANTGCKIGATAPTSTYVRANGMFKCIVASGAGVALNFSGFDFTPGAKCVQTSVREQTANNGSSGSVVMKDFRLMVQNHIGCLKAQDFFSLIQFFGNSPPTTDIYNIEIGYGRVDGGANQAFVLDADGNGDDYRSNGGFPQNNGIISYSSGGSFYGHHVYATNVPSYTFYALGVGCDLITLIGNVDIDHSPFAGFPHGDFMLQQNVSGASCAGGQVAGQRVYNNTIFNNKTILNGNNTTWIQLGYSGTGQSGPVEAIGNVLVANIMNYYYALNNIPITIVNGGGVANGGTDYQVNGIISFNEASAVKPARARVGTAGAIAWNSATATGSLTPYDGGQYAASPTQGAGNTWTTTCSGVKCGTGSGMTAYFNAGFANGPVSYLVALSNGSGTTLTMVGQSKIYKNALAPEGLVSTPLLVTNRVQCGVGGAGPPIDFGSSGKENFNAWSNAIITIGANNSGVGC